MALGEEHSELELAGIRFQIGIFEEALAVRPGDTESLRYLSHAYSVMGRLEDGLATDQRLVELLPQDPRIRYNLACSLALTGSPEAALDTLGDAIDLGFGDLALMRKDRDLDTLRQNPRYEEFERALGQRPT